MFQCLGSLCHFSRNSLNDPTSFYDFPSLPLNAKSRIARFSEPLARGDPACRLRIYKKRGKISRTQRTLRAYLACRGWPGWQGVAVTRVTKSAFAYSYDKPREPFSRDPPEHSATASGERDDRSPLCRGGGIDFLRFVVATRRQPGDDKTLTRYFYDTSANVTRATTSITICLVSLSLSRSSRSLPRGERGHHHCPESAFSA